MRVLYGLENLPRDPQNPQLPAVLLGSSMLRLNSEPLPGDVAPVESAHAPRRAALTDWLLAQCGDYARDRRDWVTAYLDWAAAQIETHRSEIAQKLARFDGLFAPEDFLWSAPRPLPRAWIETEQGWRRIDIAFWDGASLLRIDVRRGLQLPPSFERFWEGETLPTSPFRRPVDLTSV